MRRPDLESAATSGAAESEFRELVARSSQNGFRLLIAYLTLFAYFLFAYATIHAEMIIHHSSMELPILRLEVPPHVFLTIAPVSLLLLHLYVMFTLAEHAIKLRIWRARFHPLSVGNLPLRVRVYPFILNYLLHAEERHLRIAGRAVLMAVCSLGPLLVMLYGFLSATAYQVPWLNFIHGGSIVAMVFILYRIQILPPENSIQSVRRGDWSIWLIMGVLIIAVLLSMSTTNENFIESPTGFGSKILMKMLPGTILLMLGLSVFFFFFVPVPGPRYNRLRYMGQRIVFYMRLLIALFACGVLWFEASMPGHLVTARVHVFDLRKPAVQPAVGEYREDGEPVGEPRPEDYSGFEMRGRSLNGAYLAGSYLPHASIRATLLNHADLYSARLPYAHFFKTGLAGADFSHSEMRGIRFISSDLQRAHFVEAKMPDASIVASDLRRAFLVNADLRGTNFSGHVASKLGVRDDFGTGGITTLAGARLVGADLRDADLGFCDLRRAFLSGADLRNANLRDANLVNAFFRVRHPILIRTKTGRTVEARAGEVDLSGADLKGARICREDLRGARYRKADLDGVRWQSDEICKERIRMPGFFDRVYLDDLKPFYPG